MNQPERIGDFRRLAWARRFSDAVRGSAIASTASTASVFQAVCLIAGHTKENEPDDFASSGPS